MEKYFEDFLKNRKLFYNGSIRERFILFREYIHDKVRCGEINNLSTPLSVFWSVTTKCNLKCKHCYAVNNNCTNEMSLEKSFELLDKLEELNILDLTIEGGEPFAKENIIEILRYAKTKKFVIDILTNGTLIDKSKSKQLEKILNVELDRIQISLDGDEESHEKIRGKGTYQKTLSAIKNLDWLKNVTINTVVTKNNLSSLDRMCGDIINYTNANVIHFSPLMQIGNGIQNEFPNFEEARLIFMNIKEKYSNKLIISGTPIPDRELLLMEEVKDYIKETNEKLKIGCCAARSKIFINADGSIYPCTFLSSNHELKGTIFNDKFSRTWEKYWDIFKTQNIKISKFINENNIYIDYCPGIYRKEGIAYEDQKFKNKKV